MKVELSGFLGLAPEAPGGVPPLPGEFEESLELSLAAPPGFPGIAVEIPEGAFPNQPNADGIEPDLPQDAQLDEENLNEEDAVMNPVAIPAFFPITFQPAPVELNVDLSAPVTAIGNALTETPSAQAPQPTFAPSDAQLLESFSTDGTVTPEATPALDLKAPASSYLAAKPAENTTLVPATSVPVAASPAPVQPNLNSESPFPGTIVSRKFTDGEQQLEEAITATLKLTQVAVESAPAPAPTAPPVTTETRPEVPVAMATSAYVQVATPATEPQDFNNLESAEPSSTPQVDAPRPVLNSEPAQGPTYAPQSAKPSPTPASETVQVAANPVATAVAALLPNPEAKFQTSSQNELTSTTIEVPKSAGVETTATLTPKDQMNSAEKPLAENSQTFEQDLNSDVSALLAEEPEESGEDELRGGEVQTDAQSNITDSSPLSTTHQVQAPAESRPAAQEHRDLKLETKVVSQLQDRIERLQEVIPPMRTVIHLDPMELGPITLSITKGSGGNEATISTNNQQVLQALEANKQQLFQVVSSKGLDLSSLNLQQDAQGQAQQQANQQDFSRAVNVTRALADLPAAAEATMLDATTSLSHLDIRL